MQNEADIYVQEARRMIHIIRNQLLDLEQLRSSHDRKSKVYKQISGMMERLESEQERYELIVRSYVRTKIRTTIDSFREENVANKQPVLKIVK
ncbi:hypothetical protein [Paenibacillus lautus]|uniref:hypothetical protein n=1 Tax=Paenibacillus lautus TaxID=1401 RepID=UPI001C7E018C|nr:hypothetical protein [Paenibacillus lautus]MBX4152310.1 hypothetical protein [Paenibacillus lautus]